MNDLIKLCEDGIQMAQRPSVFPNQQDSETMFNHMPIDNHEEDLPNQPEDERVAITKSDGKSGIQNADNNMSKGFRNRNTYAMDNSPSQDKYNLNNNGEYDRLLEDVCGTGDIAIGAGSFLPAPKKKRKMKKPIREEDAVKKATGTPISDKSAKSMKFKADSEMSQAGKQWPRKHNETPAMCDVDEDGVEHKPQGVHNSKPAKPEESPLTKAGHDWPAKPKNDGGTFEEFGNSMNGAEVHSGDVKENWSRLDIASSVKGMPNLQTMFDAYADHAQCVTSEEFNHVCDANGYRVNLVDNDLVHLLNANQQYMFREKVDGNGRYWLKEDIGRNPSFDHGAGHQMSGRGMGPEHGHGGMDLDDEFTSEDLPSFGGAQAHDELGGQDAEFGGQDEFGGQGDQGDIDYSAEFDLDQEPPASLDIDIHKTMADQMGGDEFGGQDEFGEFGGQDEFGEDEFGGDQDFGGIGHEGGGLGSSPRGPRFESKNSKKAITESKKPWEKDDEECDDDDDDCEMSESKKPWEKDDEDSDEECADDCSMTESKMVNFLKSAKRILESSKGYTKNDVGSALTHAWETNVGMADLTECSAPVRKAINAIARTYGNFQPLVIECEAMDSQGGKSVQERTTSKAVASPNKSEMTELVGNSSLVTRKPKNTIDKTPVVDGTGNMSESVRKKVSQITESLRTVTSKIGKCGIQLSAVDANGCRVTKPFTSLTEAAAKMIELGKSAKLIAVFNKNGKKTTKLIG